MENEKTFYIQGGIYTSYGFKIDDPKGFKLVSPGGKNALPYVWHDAWRANWLCQHHSHTYRLSDDLKTAYLEKQNWQCDNEVGAPAEIKLTDKQTRQIKQSIDKGIMD